MIEAWADRLWQPWTLGAFLLVGLWCSLRSGFFQLLGARLWLKGCMDSLRRPEKARSGGLTRLQALSTALASTMGTGSIAGVATAIFFGGPGAVFWMWLSAGVGMMTGFVEKALTIRCRQGREEGVLSYLTRRLGWRRGAGWFAFWCVGASLTGGAMVQSNAIAGALSATLGWDPVWVGLVTAAAAGVVMAGGLTRVARVSQLLVPVMGGAYLLAGAAVILAHAGAVLPTLELILRCALTPSAALGGASGYGVAAAARYGVARGVFTNEAGMGTSAFAHAAAGPDSPLEEGYWGIFEVFCATLLICTVTALAILTSGAYDPAGALAAIQAEAVTGEMTGAALSARAFSAVLGPWGGGVAALCLLLFAFTSLLGWSCYGERALAHLTGDGRLTRPFRLVFLLAAAAGSVGAVAGVWALSDICAALMSWPNLAAIAVLAGEAAELLPKKKRSRW